MFCALLLWLVSIRYDGCYSCGCSVTDVCTAFSDRFVCGFQREVRQQASCYVLSFREVTQKEFRGIAISAGTSTRGVMYGSRKWS